MQYSPEDEDPHSALVAEEQVSDDEVVVVRNEDQYSGT
jgi:hypothetical protein